MPEPAAPAALADLYRSWLARLRDHAPVGLAPLLRVVRGASLLGGRRVGAVDAVLTPLLTMAGEGLAPPPPGTPPGSLRPKVSLDLQPGAGGIRIALSYYGRVPGLRALEQARDALDPRAYLFVRGGAGRPIHLVVMLGEPPRPLPLVLVEAGGREFAIPMHFVQRADPAASTPGDETRSLAVCLGLEPRSSVRGRAADLRIEAGGRAIALQVEAVLAHRESRVHGVGPVLGALPWLMGVMEGTPPVPVLQPRRLF